MPFIILDHFTNIKNARVSSVGINISHIVSYEERALFHGNTHIYATKVVLVTGQEYHINHSCEEFQAILSKVALVHDFQRETGEYYVDIRRYPKPENPPTL